MLLLGTVKYQEPINGLLEVLLTQDAISEIGFWRHNVHTLNGKVYLGAKCLPVKISFSDASDSACGGFVQLQSEGKLVFHQNWSTAESAKSSTWRELRLCVSP